MKSPKKIISALLLIACILSGIILAYSPSYVSNNITTEAELDSLIQLSFEDAKLQSNQVRIFTVEMDSNFSRKVYRIQVPSSFSKTSFHLELHKRFYSIGLETPSRVVFPERDMNIYITNEGTVFRTLRFITDDDVTDSIKE